MLTLRERWRVLEVIGFYSSLNLFPTKVDLQAWTLVPTGYTTTWKAMASKLAYPLLALGSMYKVLSLLYTLLFLGDTSFHQLMVHAEVAGAQSLATFWYYMLQIKHPAEYCRYVKMTLTGNISEGNIIERFITTLSLLIFMSV